ncbi:hypothetical protein KSX_39740 [Ktedonospora formicarum]|uniref:Uncharacterized protein n=2 Tax=Ktedonospora formicarum TaxID=2778364 RepID=A0A8J3I1E0_9CHLR|nr:hypothetical protein KSX_39740 [Ktedonospora formicarum]
MQGYFEDSQIPTLSLDVIRGLDEDRLMRIASTSQRDLLSDGQVVVVNERLKGYGDSQSWYQISGPKGHRTFDDVTEW